MTQQYGSVINSILDGSYSKLPEVGMGCTILMWSDRHPATITEVRYFKTGMQAGSPSVIIAQEDTAVRLDHNGPSENQEYEYSRNENGRTYEIRKTSKGEWRVKGTNCGVSIGLRQKYVDPSF